MLLTERKLVLAIAQGVYKPYRATSIVHRLLNEVQIRRYDTTFLPFCLLVLRIAVRGKGDRDNKTPHMSVIPWPLLDKEGVSLRKAEEPSQEGRSRAPRRR